MISAIRNKFGSKLLDSFIWLSIFIFVGAYFMPGQKSLKKSEEWVISVNDEVITYQQYLQALNGGRGESKPDAKAVLESFKIMLLIQSLTNKLNLQIAPEILNIELQKNLPGMIKEDGSIDLEGLKAKLIQAGFDQQQLAEVMENLVLGQKQIAQRLKDKIVDDLILGGLYLPKFVLTSGFKAQHALKKFEILKLDTAKFATEVNKKTVANGDLKTFFDQENLKSKKYWQVEQRSGEVWTFKLADFDIKVSDEQVKNYYDRNRQTEFVKQAPKMQVRRILLKTSEEAGKIRAQLANDPSLFESLAKNHSLDQATAKQGGLMDFFAENEVDAILSQTAFGLRTNGEISEVFESNAGFEIVQRITKSKTEFQTLEEAKAQIVKKLKAIQFAKLFPINAKRVIAQSAKDQAALSTFAASKKAVKKELVKIKPDGKDSLGSKLFELKKVDQKTFMINGEVGQIIVLTTIEPAVVKNFEAIKTAVLADYQKAEVEKLATASLMQAQQLLQAGQAAKSVAQKLGFEYSETALINQVNQAALKKGEPVELLWKLNQLNDVKFELLKDAGYVVKLAEIAQFTPAEVQAKTGIIKGAVFKNYFDGLAGSFIASLRKNGTIKVNNAIISE